MSKNEKGSTAEKTKSTEKGESQVTLVSPKFHINKEYYVIIVKPSIYYMGKFISREEGFVAVSHLVSVFEDTENNFLRLVAEPVPLHLTDRSITSSIHFVNIKDVISLSFIDIEKAKNSELVKVFENYWKDEEEEEEEEELGVEEITSKES